MFKKNNNKIDIGDRFVKTDEPSTVWIVAGSGSPVASIPHYQVVKEDIPAVCAPYPNRSCWIRRFTTA